MPRRPRPSKPQAGARRAHLDEVAERLGDRLNTRVRISLGARKGQISIDFASIQDLNRILDEIGESELRRGLASSRERRGPCACSTVASASLPGSSAAARNAAAAASASPELLQQLSPHGVQRAEVAEFAGESVDEPSAASGPSAIETATARLRRTTGDGASVSQSVVEPRRFAASRSRRRSAATAWHSATAACRP